VEVSRAQLPRPLLLGRDGGCEGQILSPEDPCSQGTSTLQLRLDSLEGWGRQPLGESARAYFCSIVSISALFDDRCAHIAGSWMCVQ
jgi:hypothetical protein